MTLEDALTSVWQQALVEGKARVELEGKCHRVTMSRAKKLRMVEFPYGKCAIVGIEQDPHSSSRWAPKARQGKRAMQFQCKGHYIGNVCEGELARYAAWRALELPD